jgi:hypothetical protein|tara:strand:+ start:3774 stop:3944 length:171 start_codon:yes stop_codon:yes gene_type:complete
MDNQLSFSDLFLIIGQQAARIYQLEIHLDSAKSNAMFLEDALEKAKTPAKKSQDAT